MKTRHLGSGLVLGSVGAMLLVLIAWVRHPHISVASGCGATVPLLLYAAVGLRLHRRCPRIALFTLGAGLLAGTVFVAEVIGEYVVLPSDNSRWGAVEFGTVFLLYATVAAAAGWRGERMTSAASQAALAAIVASLIWCLAVLGCFLLFEGTGRQAAVLRAEGDFLDFQASGGGDFSTFITEDFFGATFFHLLLGPLLAAMLALPATLIGGLARRLGRLSAPAPAAPH